MHVTINIKLYFFLKPKNQKRFGSKWGKEFQDLTWLLKYMELLSEYLHTLKILFLKKEG